MTQSTATNTYDVIIIGAGAAGLMCAIEAGKRKRSVLVIDHANKPGKKILMAGGGRCNFTNYHIQPERYISHNPHFCKSALSRYTQWDFIQLVERHKIPYHEKTLGQLFCDRKSKDILNMLLDECEQYRVEIRLSTSVLDVIQQQRNSSRFCVQTDRHKFHCESLVVASGGLSIPTMGASPFAYELAKQFDIQVYPTRAGLVPFTLHEHDKQRSAELTGISVSAYLQNDRIGFRENILFTHRGLSGPAVLQMSSYWHPGEVVEIKMLPEIDLYEHLIAAKQQRPQVKIKTVLNELFAKRLVEVWLPGDVSQNLADMSHTALHEIADLFQTWRLKPNGTEGYRTAEVTLGGVNCDALSSKTMQVKHVDGLYFIGEALDVTGWLGGYNFQWAWSSGVAAGNVC